MRYVVSGQASGGGVGGDSTGRFRAFGAVVPFAILLGTWLFLAMPYTRDATFRCLAEDHAAEIATFLVFLAGGLLGLWSLAGMRQRGGAKPVVTFRLCVAVCLLVLAGEEAAWRQRVFGWETPQAWDHYNRQDETTLHNMGPLQGRTEWLRFAFGVCGFAGVVLASMGHLRVIAPSRSLMPWFLAVIVFTIPDMVNDVAPFRGWVQDAANKSSEAVELVISITALLYVKGWTGR